MTIRTWRILDPPEVGGSALIVRCRRHPTCVPAMVERQLMYATVRARSSRHTTAHETWARKGPTMPKDITALGDTRWPVPTAVTIFRHLATCRHRLPGRGATPSQPVASRGAGHGL